jgi:hypothetical protein
MNAILSRLKEASTWRGLTIILTAFGLKLHPELADAIVMAGTAVVGGIEVIRKENKPK